MLLTPEQYDVVLRATILRMKLEICHDAARGVVPNKVESFGELHDYVDANCYGGFCDDDMQLYWDLCFGQDTEDGMTDSKMNFFNSCQTAVHEWLAEGGLK